METTARREERLALIDRVLRLSPKTILYAGVGANISVIESEIQRQVRDGGVEWLKWDAQNVHRTAVAAVQRGALAPNPRSVEAFQIAFSNKDAIQKSGIGANEEMILSALASRSLDCTAANILALIGELWDQLADNTAYTQQTTANNLRARRIAEMVGDPPSHGFSVQIGPRRYAFDKFGRSFDYQKGMAQGQGSLAATGPWSAGQGGFDSMDDDTLAQLYENWRASQDLRSLSKEQLREIVRKGGHSDLHGNHQSLRLPSTDATADSGALINEQTGEEITTQKELIRYINNPNDPYAGRRLITHKSSGKVIPAKRQRFEETVKGLRG